MREKSYIDEAVRQEVEKSNFPYQEAHWDALAAHLPKKQVLPWWQWLLPLLMLGIVAFVWWQWPKKSPASSPIASVSPLPTYLGSMAPIPANIPLRKADHRSPYSPKAAILPPNQNKNTFPITFSGDQNSQAPVPDLAVEKDTIPKDWKSIDSLLFPHQSPIRYASSAPGMATLRKPIKAEKEKNWALQLWGGKAWVGNDLVVRDTVVPQSVIDAFDSTEIARPTVHYGFQVQRKIGKRGSARLGINWVEMGSQVYNPNLGFPQPVPGSPIAVRFEDRYSYLQTELGFAYQLIKKPLVVYLHTALAPSFMLKSSRQRTLYYAEKAAEVTQRETFAPEFRSMNLYGSAGLGLAWPISPRISLMVEPTFSYGMIPIARDVQLNRSLWAWQLRSGIAMKL